MDLIAPHHLADIVPGTACALARLSGGRKSDDKPAVVDDRAACPLLLMMRRIECSAASAEPGGPRGFGASERPA